MGSLVTSGCRSATQCAASSVPSPTVRNARRAAFPFVPYSRARSGVMDWWGGDILALAILLALFILAVWLTRRG